MRLKLLVLILFVCGILSAQQKGLPNHSSQKLNCSTCHACEIPTKENPCLKACPRELMSTIDQKPEEGPNVLVIDKLKPKNDLYKPVKFSHRLHSEMAEMSGGCQMCHHYNPPGKVIGCSDCHEVNRKRNDVSKPDLKGAFHRQCMDCHRSWSGKVECVSCHALNSDKSTQTASVTKAQSASKRTHPQIIQPKVITYKTPKANPKTVNFSHDTHTGVFGLDCQQCHSNESCVKCHDQRPQKPSEVKSLSAKHLSCSKCHDTNSKTNCNLCHNNKTSSDFNHKSRTGFDLSAYHNKLSCSRCHTTKGKFTGLKGDCASCHGIWTSANFDHKKTGLKLDEIHTDLECSDCHQEKNYQKPVCGNCHEDFSYPKNLPGKILKKK
jgi:hypothetical protein